MTEVTRHSFGFPVNITVQNSIDSLDSLMEQDYSNKNVHFKLVMDKLMSKSFNQQELVAKFKEKTHANNVKVTFVYNNESTVRSKEVAEQTDIVEKFKAYATLTELKYKPSVLTKITQIQENMLLETFTPHDSFTLISASIRGAIGLMDQGHREELNVNFLEDYSEGIIAITGKIGSGKSTFLENLSPYPCMLTRTGSLKDHFCLKDSHRILTYRTSSGKLLRISMFIDGKAKNVMNRYFVETKDGDNSWEPVRSCDGSTESYTNFVESTFGPKSLFLRTSFYTNGNIKGLPDLSQATKSEKMELFSILAGTDYLSTFSEQAKLNIKAEEKAIEDIKSQLKDFDNLDQKKEDNTKIIEENNKKINEYKELIETDTAELSDYNERQKKYIEAAATYDIFRTQLLEKQSQKRNLSESLLVSVNNISAYEQQLSEMDTYKEQLKWYEDNSIKRHELQTKETELRDEFNSLQHTLDKEEKDYNTHKDQANEWKNIRYKCELNIETAQKGMPSIDGICPVCGRPLTDHMKQNIEKEIKEIQKKIASLKEDKASAEEHILIEEKWLSEHSLQNYKTRLSAISQELTEIANDIITIDSYMSDIDIDNIKDIINNTDKALKYERNQKEHIEKELSEVTVTIADLDKKLSNIPTDYSDKIARLQRGIADSQQQIATLTAEVTMAEKELSYLAQSEVLIKKIKQEMSAHKDNIKDFEIIQSAFSNNGIQALELDSAAPEISDIANSILRETYGDRFSISFDTQRDAKDGRKIDDFVIKVFDANSGREKRLDLISSGEGALIKQTLYYAFSVIRIRRTGFCFRTRFLDESDGSLDSETRIQYMKMIEAAHNQCKAVQTILITHSQELKELIDQKIEF